MFLYPLIFTFHLQSLLVLNYLIKNGSERVVTSAREHIYDLRSLENYTFIDELGKDQGVNIRHKVRELIDFIQDDEKLREERKKAKKNKDKYIGMSSDMVGMRFGGKFIKQVRCVLINYPYQKIYAYFYTRAVIIFYVNTTLLKCFHSIFSK